MTRIALATCAALPDLDPDEQLLLEPLRALGADAIAAVWDDAIVDWDAFDLVVIRSTWDYVPRRDEFLAWTRSVARIVNPAAIVAWNTDKTYLRDLAQAGVPVVPTEWIEPGQPIQLQAEGRYVLKPAIGAGSVDAGLFDLSSASERRAALVHAERLLDTGQTVMAQPYLERIEAEGEAALIFFDGEFSHVINKGAMLTTARKVVADLYTEEVITPRVASPDEMAVARAALAAIPGGADQIAYARIDLVPGPGGEPLVIELELTEPSLFLGKAPGSADRLARHLFDRAGRR
jgi:hypothetical protein